MKRIPIVICMTACLNSFPIFAAPASLNLNCIEQKKNACNIHSCKNIEPSINIKIHIEKENNFYSRCDKNGCNKYQASVSKSGVFIDIINSSMSSFVKINTQDLFYMETASLHLNAFIGFGICTVAH